MTIRRLSIVGENSRGAVRFCRRMNIGLSSGRGCVQTGQRKTVKVGDLEETTKTFNET